MTKADELRQKFSINSKEENKKLLIDYIVREFEKNPRQTIQEYWTKFPNNPHNGENHFGFNMYEYMDILDKEGFRTGYRENSYGVYYTLVTL